MNLEKKKIACKHFGFYVGVLAVLLPLSLVMIFHTFVPITQSGTLTLTILALAVFALYPYIGYVFYDVDMDTKKEQYVDYSLYASGFFTLVLVGYLVFLTGGMSHSILAFLFFFFPAAIAITFEAKWGLIIVCVTSFGCIAANVYVEHTNNISNDGSVFETTEYLILYILFVAIHLFVIYLLETKSIKRA